MCTVSWHLLPHAELGSQDLHIYFNRDEQRTRPEAISPRTTKHNGVQLLHPTDPKAGGTWLAANDSGCVVALLNDYSAPAQYSTKSKPSTSRGLLVKQIASESSLADCQDTITSWLKHFTIPAFTLLRWDSTHSLHHWHWNGMTLTEQDDTPPPLTSSSWQTSRVEEMRRAIYLNLRPDLFHEAERINAHLVFQNHQLPDDPRSSVCMSRPKTKTVSLTHVHLSHDKVTMHYYTRNDDQAFSAPVTTNMQLKQ